MLNPITHLVRRVVAEELARAQAKQHHPSQRPLIRFSTDEGTPLPTKAHAGDAGYDLTAAFDTWIPVGQTRLVRTGTRAAIPTGHVGLLIIRSGLGVMKRATLSNSVGVIDAGYRGEICASVTNNGNEPLRINQGDRFVQLVVVPLAKLTVAPGFTIDTTRGEGRFGSTGR